MATNCTRRAQPKKWASILALAALTWMPAASFAQPEEVEGSPEESPSDTLDDASTDDSTDANSNADDGIEPESGDDVDESEDGAFGESDEEDPLTIPEFVREDAMIPEPNAEREAAEAMVRESTGPDWPVMPFGRTWIGTAVSERDAANLWVRQRFGLADPDHTEEMAAGRTERTTTRHWGIADVGLEIGLGGDKPALPSIDARASGWMDQSLPGTGASTAGTLQELHWGTLRVRRNSRILRGIRFTLSPAQVGYRLSWDEREGLEVFAHFEASTLGYVHTSAQGRARTFNGVEIAYLSIAGGPEFEFHPDIRMRVELGGFAEWAAGAQSGGIDVAGRQTGPTGTFRNDYSMFGDLTFEFTDFVDLTSRIQLDFATDSYRNENNDAWRFIIAVAGRY